MAQRSETTTSTVRIRQKRLSETPVQVLPSEKTKEKLFRANDLLKNMGLTSALVLCAVTLRSGALPALDPAADIVMAAATDHSLLDDQLGKLSFVSALFPEAVLVFGENASAELELPDDLAQVTHAWSQQEPYMAWENDGGAVTASADGEVTGVYHGNGDEQIVRIMGNDGMTCIYGNLAEVNVQTGDAILKGEVIGRLLKGEDFVLELQKNGISVDPTIYLTR